MSVLSELHAKYLLSQKEIEQIGQVIIDHFTAGIFLAAATPKVVILGGQPGSGKSELTETAQSMLGENTVICNADEYRDFHPKS